MVTHLIVAPGRSECTGGRQDLRLRFMGVIPPCTRAYTRTYKCTWLRNLRIPFHSWMCGLYTNVHTPMRTSTQDTHTCKHIQSHTCIQAHRQVHACSYALMGRGRHLLSGDSASEAFPLCFQTNLPIPNPSAFRLAGTRLSDRLHTCTARMIISKTLQGPRKKVRAQRRGCLQRAYAKPRGMTLQALHHPHTAPSTHLSRQLKLCLMMEWAGRTTRSLPQRRATRRE